MNRQRVTRAAGVALALVLLAGTAGAGWWDDFGEAQPVTLGELMENPHAYRGREVTFECVFHQVTTFYNPYYTRFLPSVYVNFSAWPAEAEIWKRDVFVASHPFLFLERDHKDLDTVLGLERFTRLRLTGYVQNCFKNSPWIEVRHIRVLDGALSKDTLREIILADQAADEGRWGDALAGYRSAAGDGLPEEVRGALARKEGEALLRLGRLDGARRILEQVVEKNPKDQQARALLAETRDGLGLDALPVAPDSYERAPAALPAPGEEPAPGATPDVEEGEDFVPRHPAALPPRMKPLPEEPAEEPAPAAEPHREPGQAGPEPADEEEPQKQPDPEKDPAPVPSKRMSGPV